MSLQGKAYDLNSESEVVKSFMSDNGKKIKELSKDLKPYAFNMQFWGEEQDDDIAHSDIDDFLRKSEYKDYVLADSEGGGFYAWVKEGYENEVAELLKEKFPTLVFSFEKDNDPESIILPGFNAWDDCQAWCDKNNIEITLPDFNLSKNDIKRDKIYQILSRHFTGGEHLIPVVDELMSI